MENARCKANELTVVASEAAKFCRFYDTGCEVVLGLNGLVCGLTV